MSHSNTPSTSTARTTEFWRGAEIAIRLSRLGFPLKLVKRLAVTRPTAASGREASQKLALLFGDMRREIETRMSALHTLAEDIERAADPER